MFDPVTENPPRSAEEAKMSTKRENQVDNMLDERKATQSLWVMGLITIVSECARGVQIPTLWLLIDELGGNKIDLGFLISLFFVGRLCSSAVFELFAEHCGFKLSLCLAKSLLGIGALLMANSYKTDFLGVLYIAQIFMGLGSGTIGVTRMYVMERLPRNRRTPFLARLATLQVIYRAYSYILTNYNQDWLIFYAIFINFSVLRFYCYSNRGCLMCMAGRVRIQFIEVWPPSVLAFILSNSLHFLLVVQIQ